MLRSVIRILYVFIVKHSAVINVDLVESFIYEAKSSWIQVTFNSTKELIEINCTIVIFVKCLEKGSDVDICEL